MRLSVLTVLLATTLLVVSPPSRAWTADCDAEQAALAEELLREAGFAHGGGAYREEADLATRSIVLCPGDLQAYFTRLMARAKFAPAADLCLDQAKVEELAARGGEVSEFMQGILQKAGAYCRKNGYRPPWSRYWDETDPDRAGAHFYRGVEQIAAGEIEAAEREFRKAKELASEHSAPDIGLRFIADIASGHLTLEAARRLSISTIFFRYKDVEYAIEEISKVIDLLPSYPPAYNQRGVYRREIEDYDGALADYAAAIKLQPSFARAYYNRTFVYHARGQHSKVLEDLKKASDLDRRYANAYLRYLDRYGE